MATPSLIPAYKGQNSLSPPPALITAGSAAGLAALALDNGAPRAYHTLHVVGSAGITAGAVQLWGSLDAVNYIAIGSPVTAVANGSAVQNAGPLVYRYLTANITTAIVGGTVTCTVASA